VTLKNLIQASFNLIASAVVACTLAGCGGGGRSDDGDNGIRPQSLNGVTLNFGGARLTFTAATPNASSTGTEIGGIFYEQLSEAPISFTPADSTELDGESLSWPPDLGGSTRYEYTPIDGSTGRLLIYADSVDGGTFLNNGGDPAAFDAFALYFTAGGGSISSIQAVLTARQGARRYVAEFSPSSSIGGLSENTRPLPVAWDGVNKGPGFIAISSFDGKVLTLNPPVEDSDDVELQFGPFDADGRGGVVAGATTERGQAALTVTRNLVVDPDNVEVASYQVSYIQAQPFGTENVNLDISYLSGSPGPLPPNETIILTFLGGGFITNGAGREEIRTGTYVRQDGSAGSFILDVN
jgi:hypothetical protein